jgi:NAD-dependent deacetylase
METPVEHTPNESAEGLHMRLPETLVERLASARRVVVLTGAGVSAESGVPTFRDAQTGLWARYRAEELATPEAFARDPDLVWRWYAWRRRLVEAAEPNAAHHALARMEALVPEFLLVTQNVDGLHARAGSRRMVELHGDIRRTICSRERCEVELDRAASHGEHAPTCPRCGAKLRPAVVWFGEPLPAAELQQAMTAAGRCDVLLSVGTSGLVVPAAWLVPIARDAGAAVGVINTNPFPGEPGVEQLIGRAATVLPQLVRRVWKGADAG